VQGGVVYDDLMLLGYESVNGIPHLTQYFVLVIAQTQDRTRWGW
jgi:hypothetical protein